MVALLFCLLVCAMSIFADEAGIVDVVEEARSGSVLAVLDGRSTVATKRWRRSVSGAAHVVHVEHGRVFVQGKERENKNTKREHKNEKNPNDKEEDDGMLFVLDDSDGSVMWSSSSHRGLSALGADLDGDGTQDVAALRGRCELTVRSGHSGGGPVWARKTDEEFGDMHVITGGEQDTKHICVYGVNASGFVAQCWSLTSQTVLRRGGNWETNLEGILHVFPERKLLTKDCRLLQFDGQTNALVPVVADFEIPFKQCRPKMQARPPIKPFSARYFDGMLEGFDARGHLHFRMDNLVDCASDPLAHEHTNLFSPARKLVLASGVVCLARRNQSLVALLVDGADGSIRSSAFLSECKAPDDAAVRLQGNSAVILCRASHGYLLTMLMFYVDAPIQFKVQKEKRESKKKN